MRTLLILASALGVVYAGVGNLSPQEEADALKLFEKLCGGGGGGYGGGYGGGSGGEGQDIGGTLVYCKRGPGDKQETLNHQVQVRDDSVQKPQIVFVQPPAVRYTHRVLVQGSGAQGQQTKVYVLPQKATHELSADYRGTPAQAVKPTVYFLKGEGPSNGYGPPANPPPSNYGPPANPPPSNYGPPANPPPSNYGPPARPPPSNYGPPPSRPSNNYGPPPQQSYGVPIKSSGYSP